MSSWGAAWVSSHSNSCQTQCRQLVTVEANPNLIPFWKRNVAVTQSGGLESINAAIDYAGHPRVPLTTGRTRCRYRRPIHGHHRRRHDAVRILAANSIGDFVLVADIEGEEQGILWDASALVAGLRQMIIELHQTVVSHHSRPGCPFSNKCRAVVPFLFLSRKSTVE